MIDFTKRKLTPHIIQFSDAFGFCANLVIGGKKALLFDTMCGVGNLKKAVEAVTDLPVTVVLSHCHFDHIGGAFLYKQAWLSKTEQEYIDEEIPHLCAIEQKAKEIIPPGEADFFAPCKRKPPEFLSLKEGDFFDLGGVVLETVALPGHTTGSMGLLCAEDGVILTGDAITPIMCLFFNNSLPVQGYINTLEKLQELNFEYFITSHHHKLFSKKELPDFIECAKFAQNDDAGMKFQHDILPEFTGTLHIYRGNNSENDDFLALIEKPRKRKRKLK